MNTPQRTLSQPGYSTTRHFPDEDFPTGYLPDHDVLLQFSLVLYFCQVTGDIQETDFDLPATVVIYTRCKSCVIDDTEGLQIKILR